VVVSAHVDPRRLEDALGAARRDMLAHVADCRDCRRAVAAYDPTLLFALLAEVAVPAAILEAVSTGTAKRVAEASRPAPLRAVAAAAALAAAISGMVLLRSTLAPSPPPEVAVVPRADVEVHAAGPVSQVVDFTVGDTQVVMVYNPELQL
jgi:hypothetical protein